MVNRFWRDVGSPSPLSQSSYLFPYRSDSSTAVSATDQSSLSANLNRWMITSQSGCPIPSLKLANGITASVDCLLAAVALTQLLRIYFHNPNAKWTRQKVFHIMVFAANVGYGIYFLLAPWAACHKWTCWHHVCGFSFLAVPQIIFLATFLLLLSFWIDLCHQATDKEEEEEEEEEGEREEGEGVLQSGGQSSLPTGREALNGNNEPHVPLLEKYPKRKRSGGCTCWRSLRVRGRQRVVIAVVMVVCLLTGAFAVLIWIGLGDNNIDSEAIAQVHADFFAAVMLLAGGGLAFYGLLLFSKMSRLRSGKSSVEIGKVAWLAAVCLVCFSIRAFLVFVKSVPGWPAIQFRDSHGNLYPLWLLAYYIIGEAIPSAVVLVILKDMPPRSRESSAHGGQEYTLAVQALEDAEAILPQWVVPLEGDPYPVVPSPPSSQGSREAQGSRD